MKKILSILIVALTLGTLGFGDVHAYVNRQSAHLIILDKTSGKTHSFTVPVGQTTEYEKLSFTVRACKETDPFQAENAFMFIEIMQNNDLIFSDWMNKNEPGQNPLQNADYDMWLVRCE